jgi:hypothetical protein
MMAGNRRLSQRCNAELNRLQGDKPSAMFQKLKQPFPAQTFP